MKCISFYFFLTIVIQTVCFAEATYLTADQRKVLEDAARFHQVRATTNLPPAILALCADHKGRLAEPGRRWEATDLIMNASLPTKRLVWAAISGEYYVVHYERGGRGHSFQVLVALLGKGETKPKVLWHGVGGPFKDYAAFVGGLRSGKLDDTLDYAH